MVDRPYPIALVIKADNIVYHALGNHLGFGLIIKILIILGMKGGHQRNLPAPSHTQRFLPGCKGALCMHNVKGNILQPPAVAYVKAWQAQAELLPGELDAVLQQHRKGVLRRSPRRLWRNVPRFVAHGHKCFTIALRYPSHPVQTGRIGIHKLPHNQRIFLLTLILARCYKFIVYLLFRYNPPFIWPSCAYR